ncbi:MAG: UDP-N-acetylmuramoyl-L-alanyl-D-glutamate--2,6-diaminopimelate ligase [Candidatus Eremiobacteraeota bacterium]|nr:UDP-N-acetylmuramoyl-L-alanyl-D-glutamate--2,6-diaminopimelate ligase [Candidatus Eremiobacteraeota bacterium]
MPRAIDLEPLVAALDGARVIGALDRIAVGIVHDSRAVRTGSVFVAVRGQAVDGHDYVGAAIAAGARAVVVDDAYAAANAASGDTTTIVVSDTRRALSRLAAAFFDYPSSALFVAGVTGTNGKTTTTHLIAAILAEAGIPAGLIGTLGARFARTDWPLANTTPLASELQGLLADMRDLGAEAVAMEVSSHALALDRVADVSFAVAALTNVTRDHLDFHETFEAYAATKRELFERASKLVLDVDDDCGRRWAQAFAASGRPVTTYGFADDAAVRATGVVVRNDGSRFAVDGRIFDIRLPGRFNVQNALAAICVARALGVDDATSARALAAFTGVPGRMERLSGAGIDVLVDYAHTPDALEAALRAAREMTRGELAVIFGCGGDRDRGKRPEMGRIASALADRVVVTSDNPRREDPRAIVADILAGMAASERVHVQLDRRAAIGEAVASAAAGDVLVVAGKGHETYQVVGESVLPFDDRTVVRSALDARARLGGAAR